MKYVKRYFITHKGIQTNENITIEVEKNEKIEVKGLHEKVDIRTKDLIKDEKLLVDMFNKHYANIIEKTSGIVEIVENYTNHPSIIKVKEIVKEKPIFDFPEATTEEIKLLSH